MEPLAGVSGGPIEGILRHGGVGRESGLAFFNMAPSSDMSFDNFAVPPLCAVSACGGSTALAFDFTMAPSSGVSFDLFAVAPLCAVSACGGSTGLAFDFNMAPSSGVSLDLFAVPPLCAVAACGGLPAADFCGLGVNAGDVGDPEVNAGDVGDPGVGAVASTGVAAVSVPAAPSVEAVAAAGVAPVATEDDAAPSSLISSSFHSISAAVKKRLAFSCRLPYCNSRPFCQEGLSVTIWCCTSSIRCFAKIQSRRCCASCTAARSPRAVAAASWERQRAIW